jgi:hypothetical protein
MAPPHRGSEPPVTREQAVNPDHIPVARNRNRNHFTSAIAIDEPDENVQR